MRDRRHIIDISSSQVRFGESSPDRLTSYPMAQPVKLLRPDGHGVMAALFQAYACAGAGVSAAEFDSARHAFTAPVFMALLADLGCTGEQQEAILSGGAFEVRGGWQLSGFL